MQDLIFFAENESNRKIIIFLYVKNCRKILTFRMWNILFDDRSIPWMLMPWLLASPGLQQDEWRILCKELFFNEYIVCLLWHYLLRAHMYGLISKAIFFKITSLALGQSHDCPSASEIILKNIVKSVINQPWKNTQNMRIVYGMY